MQQININVLKPHPQNSEYFDDLTGEEFERLKNSIRDEKIYTDILVSPDMTIISGHQRVRAAKELGMTLVPVKIDEDLQDEESKLRALISNNFGRRKNSPEKDRKALAKYVSLRGYSPNGDRKTECQSGTRLTLDEIAKELKTSKRDLQRALSIERNLTEPMKELLDTGVISKTVAADVIASLSEEEQTELIASMDTTQKLTQKEVQKYIDKLHELEEENADQQRTIREQNEKLSSAPRPVEKIVEVEKPETKFRMAELERKIRSLTEERDTLKKETALNKEQAAKFEKLQNDISFLTRKKSDLFRQIESATELSGLTVRLQNILEKELAPIKFKRCMEELDNVNSQVCKNNLIEIIGMIDSWSSEIKEILNIKCNTRYDINVIDM